MSGKTPKNATNTANGGTAVFSPISTSSTDNTNHNHNRIVAMDDDFKNDKHQDNHDDINGHKFVSHSDSHPLLLSSPFILYPSRWIMLAIFSILSLSNAMAWIAYAPIATQVGNYYDVSNFLVNGLSLIYMIIYVIFPALASKILLQKGLRAGLVYGALFNFVGAIIRVLPYPFLSEHQYFPIGFICAFVGQTLCSFAQLFILASPVMLAQSWFGMEERVSATAIGAIANQVGVMVGFGLPPLVNNDVVNLLLAHLGIIAIPTLLTVLFFKSSPPTPPSFSAYHSLHPSEKGDDDEMENLRSMSHVLWTAIRSKPYVILLGSSGILIGTSYAVSTVLSTMLEAANYDDTTAAYAGIILVASGIVSAGMIGVIADRYRNYKRLVHIALIATTITLIWFIYSSTLEGHTWMVLLSAGALGFCITSVLPLCMDISAECTYPLPASITTQLLMCNANLMGVILTVLVSGVQIVSVEAGSWIFAGFMVFAAVLWYWFAGENKRLNLEHTHTEDTHNYDSYTEHKVHPDSVTATTLHHFDNAHPPGSDDDHVIHSVNGVTLL